MLRTQDLLVCFFSQTVNFYFVLLLLLLLLLSCVSHVRLCATPWTAVHQVPLSLGFSRQEHWSGLPFPSPMHESESESEVASRVRLLVTPWTAAHQAPLSMGFSRQEYWNGVPFPSPKQEKVKSEVTQSCPTPSDPTDCSH